MGQLWNREKWNDIIRRLNDLAVNPPDDTDCVPLETLDEVPQDHIWTKTDTTLVQNKLTEICEDNTWPTELRLWSQTIIDEIETAIEAGWCGCEDDCLPQCDNAYGYTTTYCGSFEITACKDCGECGSNTCPPECTEAERLAVTTAGGTALAQMSLWATAWEQYCRLNDELETLQTQLTALQAARDTACAGGPSPACAAAQALVDAKQVEVDQKTQERDAKLIEADGYEQEAETAADTSISLANLIGTGGPAYSSFIPDTGAWTNTACDELGPTCLGRDPARCRVWWSVQSRTTTHFPGGGSSTGFWTLVLGGGFTRGGSPFITDMPGCGVVSAYACSSCCTPPCTLPPCWNGCNGISLTEEVRINMEYPSPTGEQCCE